MLERIPKSVKRFSDKTRVKKWLPYLLLYFFSFVRVAA
ncbi:hypothetical protein QBD01_000058 [Ochrobactrum sp. 19YEA23]|nr:hypothetical protein [Ochrobactrum sp. 19YEA23]